MVPNEIIPIVNGINKLLMACKEWKVLFRFCSSLSVTKNRTEAPKNRQGFEVITPFPQGFTLRFFPQSFCFNDPQIQKEQY